MIVRSPASGFAGHKGSGFGYFTDLLCMRQADLLVRVPVVFLPVSKLWMIPNLMQN